ncbi:cartilage intermediate layer protein 2-like [Nothobranchius furzeri]|uniref:WxxW domain-containing protein n=1 Tax=Nothobranchius furzeri TaxID=105023 RepID=A0A8C6MEK2_NOTFU|nr:cartilage intermediate layer protein 2-like [Nothobranchius furzeri]
MTKLMSLTVLAVLLLACMKPSIGMAPSADPIIERLCWTSWYDRDNPGGTGDWEDLRNLRLAYPGQICPRPLDIQAVTVIGNIPAESTGQNFYAYNTILGFICLNADQPSGQQCSDYKVRFGCPCFFHVN